MKCILPLLSGAITLLTLVLPATAHSQYVTQQDLSPIQDPDLQRALNRVVEANGWGDMIEQRRFAVTLVVMNRYGGYRLAMLNGTDMLYAASLPKIAILFAAMVASQEGDLQIEGALQQDLHDMIRLSCNPCATRAMEAVGRKQLLAILQRSEYAFYDEDLWGGLWVGKDYAGHTAHQRDPLKGLSHGATAFQVARLYYRLDRGTLLDPEHTLMMRDMLSRPGISHKFVKALQGQEGVELWRKSGSWRDFHADSVLVESANGRYILVGLVEDANGEQQLETLARVIHELVGQL